MAIIEPEWRLFEKDVAKFFANTFGLHDADKKIIGGYEIDCWAEADDFVFVVECKHTEPLDPAVVLRRDYRASILEFIGKMRGINAYLAKQQRARRPLWVFCVKGGVPIDTNYDLAKQHGVVIWTADYLKLLKKLSQPLGDQLFWQVIKEFGYGDERIQQGKGLYFRYPALPRKAEFNGEEVDVYNFFIPASDLLPLSYVYRIKEDEPESYQRLLEPEKVRRIGAFIDKGNTINTSLLINLPKGTRFQEQAGSENFENIFGFISIPKIRNSVRVIDGQHRLYGFVRAQTEKARNQKLPVIALVGATGAQEAQAFLDINKNQTTVKKNDLLVILAKTDPDGAGIIPELILRMNEDGPFKGRIQVSGQRQSSDFKLSLATMTTVMSTNNILVQNQKVKSSLVNVADFANVEAAKRRAKKYIDDFFNQVSSEAATVSKKWSEDFVFTNPGFQILIPVLREANKYADGDSLDQVLSTLIPQLKSFFIQFKDEVDRIRGESSASARAKYSYEALRSINKTTPGFAAKSIQNYLERNVDDVQTTVANSHVQQAIQLEREVKDFVIEMLSSTPYGDAWFDHDQVVDKKLRDRAYESQKTDTANYFDLEDESSIKHPLYYLPMGSVKDIIRKNRHHFKSVVASGFDQFVADIDLTAIVGNKRHEGIDVDIPDAQAAAFQSARQRIGKLIAKSR